MSDQTTASWVCVRCGKLAHIHFNSKRLCETCHKRELVQLGALQNTLVAGNQSQKTRRTLRGLLDAVEKAVWEAIDDGKGSLLCYARRGPNRNVLITIELQNETPKAHVVGEWEE